MLVATYVHIQYEIVIHYNYTIYMYIGQSQSEVRVTTHLDHHSRHVDDDGRQVIHEQQYGKP